MAGVKTAFTRPKKGGEYGLSTVRPLTKDEVGVLRNLLKPQIR